MTDVFPGIHGPFKGILAPFFLLPSVAQDIAHGMLPLFAAAAIAYEQVFPTRRSEGVTPSVDELDPVALALSAHLPIYGVRAAEREPSRISDEELMQGMFWGGAMRFELGDDVAAITQPRFASRTSSACSMS